MAAPGEPIARDSGASAAALAFGVSPRLNPRKAARFEFGDDAAGHVFIETGARRGGLGASILAACAALAGLAPGCPPRAAPNPPWPPPARGWAAAATCRGRPRGRSAERGGGEGGGKQGGTRG